MAQSSPQPNFISNGLNGPSSNLPIILCLHGSGTNATIFNVQTMRLQRALLKSFRFVFLDGPIDSSPGPGVLPMFEGCGPYLRWLRPDESVTHMPPETRKLIVRAILAIEGDVVGVLGFSQGSKLAAGLLWEQEFRRRNGDVGGRGIGDGFNFKFGVFTHGISPPMTEHLVEDEQKDNIIELPSLHVVGADDEWAESGRTLFDRYFDKKTAKKLEFDIGHRLPTEEAETAKIAEEILRIYDETCR
ncbi:uncharacterized protein BP5553_04468 [Venustampulla echinocandica]|uniref:Serine hydrolase domain-containing protein n=1 Tax=Venustampulla echinocandica TaxID=2656787 RepID=A0A370TND3_9HELO|nr:uncharacterized protein BP5553_04468 [Venustampulla echinocandica]RDL37035.1 hypothetical protein BP5553_04468 [Venustampulla echinocandica]